ncbi:MAG: division/cell wall cluster transcriptional repressor MraZ [Phycisphaerae bacterium]
MPLFVGEFEQNIDSKHRLSIASALREGAEPDDGENFYLVLGGDGHLWLYPDKYYTKLLSKMRRSKLPVAQSRGIAMMFAFARVVKPDAQGRVVLPEPSLKRAACPDAVTLVGSGDHIEIWPTDEWKGFTDEAMPAYGQLLLEAADRLNMDDE